VKARRALPALFAAAALARGADAGPATDPKLEVEERIRMADSVRVARVREPAPGEIGSAGDDHLNDIVIEREARVDSAWKASMADVITEAMHRFPAPEICRREHPEASLVEQPADATRMVPPKYPKDAKKAKIEGRVLVRATIGVDGLVTEVKVLESVPALDAAAIASVREWQFTPALDCSRN